jgi:hypothetical protein
MFPDTPILFGDSMKVGGFGDIRHVNLINTSYKLPTALTPHTASSFSSFHQLVLHRSIGAPDVAITGLRAPYDARPSSIWDAFDREAVYEGVADNNGYGLLFLCPKLISSAVLMQ